MKGAYISLFKPFREGPPVAQLVREGLLHPGVELASVSRSRATQSRFGSRHASTRPEGVDEYGPNNSSQIIR